MVFILVLNLRNYIIRFLFYKNSLERRIWVSVTNSPLPLDPLKLYTWEYSIQLDLSKLDLGKATSSVHSSHHAFKYDPFRCSMCSLRTRYMEINLIRFDELWRLRKMYFTLVILV